MKYFLFFLTMTLSACSTFKPEALNYAHLDFENPNHKMNYGVYTPPGWHANESLPVILFLHGGGGSHLSLERYGAHEYLDEKIIVGEIPRVIIVTPDGNNGFWENWYDGSYRYRDWVLNSVFPKVQKEFNTLSCPEHCHLAGTSMGGYGVLRFAYEDRDRFSSVSAMSALIYSDEQANSLKSSWFIRRLLPIKRIFGDDPSIEYRRDNPYNAWVDDPDQQRLRLQLIWGDNDYDNIKLANQAFQKRLQENNIVHDHYVYSGRHKWIDWVPNFERIINFLVKPSPP